MADIEKLDLIIKNIETDPERHFQADWGRRTRCGTVFCVAGWAAHLDHAELEWSKPDDFGQQRLLRAGGVAMHHYGAVALDLTEDQAEQLFHEDNSLATIKAMRDRLVDDVSVGWDALVEIADEHGDR